jgi:tetratricopeptide (TPR) repeat protein
MRSLGDAPLLMIQTARPEFRAPWPPPDGQALITLGRLSQRDTCALVQSTPAGEPLSAAVVESIANRAAGIPLFAEELARTMGAQGRSAQSHEIPDSLSASVNARLDRTGPAREVAQLAAVCGDEVAPEILRAVARRSAAELEPLLERLIEADILVMQPRPTGDVLAFSHSLFREGIYETLLRSQRRELHEDVADTIVTAFPTLASAHPEIIARHLSSAGRHQRAAEAWHSAASVAMSRGAFREAEEACQTALDNLGQLPDAQAHAAVEITIQNALVAALQVTRGYSAAKTREAADRAHELAEKGGSVENVMIEMAARFSALSSAGRYITAGQVADQFLELALREGRRDALAHAYSFQATARYRRGDLAGAERCFQQGEPLFAEAGFLRSLGGVAQTYGTASRNVWMLGRPDEARRRMAYALSVAGANESPYDTAFSTYMAAILAVLMRNAAEGRRLAEQAIDLADANGFRQFATISRVALGRALIDLDPSPRAVDLIETGIAGMAETGSRVAMTLYLAWLAEAQAAVGSLPAAIETIDRALLLNPEELFFRPELLRIRGELWGMSGDVSRADDDMQAALSLAADMEALSLKLRAALSLHRLHARAGSRAATIVAAVYGQFREGHDTADLAEAAAVVRPTTTA